MFKWAELQPGVQLQEHQQRIADRLTGPDPRLLVYHGLGSGKTLSALAAVDATKQPYAVALPASLRQNFEKEVERFTTGHHPEIASYTGLALGKDFTNNPETLVFDEAHRLRSPSSASTQAARRAAERARRVLLLTGSPIVNRPSDLAPLMTMLGSRISPDEFTERFVREQQVQPGFFARRRGVTPGVKQTIANANQLKAMLKGKVDYVPSTTPEGVNVKDEVVSVPLSATQQRIQNAIRKKLPPGFLWKTDREFPLSKDELIRLNSFMGGLRQVALSTRPFRADDDPLTAARQSTKIQKALADLKESLKADPKHKAIAYSNFVDAGIEPYAAALEEQKIPYGVLHGGIAAVQRKKTLDEYNKGLLRVLLLGPAAAEGISTRGTNLIQMLDPHWHESRSQQAVGRGLRFDSHKDLPEHLKNVAIKRYVSTAPERSWMDFLLGRQRQRTADEILLRLAADKERLNDEFRQVLREVGTSR